MIKKCSCSHKGQDSLHGTGNRVMNFARNAGSGGMWRCTVCLKLYDATADERSKYGLRKGK